MAGEYMQRLAHSGPVRRRQYDSKWDFLNIQVPVDVSGCKGVFHQLEGASNCFGFEFGMTQGFFRI
jgi:hypothetical protein